MRPGQYVVNVDVAVHRDGRYCCIERGAEESHASGALAFPGGKVEDPPEGADAVRTTARRELREEVGLEVRDLAYVCSRTFTDDTGTACLNVVTRGEYAGGEAHRAAPEEVAAVRWLTPAEIRADEASQDYFGEYVDEVEAARTQ